MLYLSSPCCTSPPHDLVVPQLELVSCSPLPPFCPSPHTSSPLAATILFSVLMGLVLLFDGLFICYHCEGPPPVFHSGFAIVHSHQEWRTGPASPHPHQYRLVSIAPRRSHLSVPSQTAPALPLPSPASAVAACKPRVPPAFISEPISRCACWPCTLPSAFPGICSDCSERSFPQKTSFRASSFSRWGPLDFGPVRCSLPYMGRDSVCP